MKQKITIMLLLIATTFTANAQHLEKIIEGNTTLNFGNNNFSNGNGITFIKQTKKGSAWKIGLQQSNKTYFSTGYNKIADTNYFLNFSSLLKTIQLNVGYEQRKYITKDFYIYAGADALFGINREDIYANAYIQTGTNNYIQNVSYNYKDNSGLNLGTNFYAGARANIGKRFVIGYQISKNYQFINNINYYKPQNNFKQSVSIGWRF